MADTGPTPIDEPPATEEEGELIGNFSTILLALVSMAIYLLFLKPTGGNENETETDNTPRRRQQQREGGRRPVPQQQQQQQPTRRRLNLSENAIEVLGNCRSIPPHVSLLAAESKSKRSIGGFDLLLESGLVAFSNTLASGESLALQQQQQQQPRPKPGSDEAPEAVAMDRGSLSEEDPKKAALLLRRKERAKILSRLFAVTDRASSRKGLPAPPAKGSTFVIGVSKEKHLSESDQLSSLLRVIGGLATHYTVLLVVSPDASSDSSYESTQKLHSEITNLLRGGNDDEKSTLPKLPESLLPSHRILLAGSARGRVALVRQLSTNIGLTVDFDKDVREELERFGYEVSIVEDWKTILPAKGTAA